MGIDEGADEFAAPIDGDGAAGDTAEDRRSLRPFLRIVPEEPEPSDVTEATFGRLSQYAKATPHLSDEVVAAVKRGGPEAEAAWTAIYLAYAGGLKRFLLLKLRHRRSVDDALSTTFVRAIGRIEKFRGGTTPELRGWLFSIARNLALDSIAADRKLDYLAEYDGPDLLAPEGDARLIAAADVAHLRKLLAELDPDDREVLWLRIAVGLDSETVGRIVGKSPGAVRMQQMRALAALTRRWDA